MVSNLDIFLLIAFLGANFIIGLLAGRRVKTLRQYAIGDKDFSTATLTYSLVVTWISGGFLFITLQNIYTTGLSYMLAATGGSLAMLLYGRILAIRMGEFLNNLSVAEAMRDLYGRNVQIITAISGILYEVGFLAVQFQVITKILVLVFGIEDTRFTIVAASLAILYSAFGGVRSVTITDIFQFVVFCTVLPILGLLIWRQFRGPDQVVHTLTTNPIFSVRETVGWNINFLSTLALTLYYATPNLAPAIFQRIAIAKDIQQVKASFTYAAAIRFMVVLAAAWIAVLLLSHNPQLDPSKLVNYLIKEYAYPGLKGLIAVGLIAKAMSAADAGLNASSVLVINDIIKPFRPNFKESLIPIRIVSLLLGILALAISVRVQGLLRLGLLAGSMYVPIVTAPLFLAIFGFRTSTRAVLVGMVAGFITVLVWDNLLPYRDINSIIPGMLANFLFLMGSHYLLGEKGGWVGIKEPGPVLAARQARKDAWNGFIKAIKHPNLYGYLVKNLPAKEGIYVLFALYVLGAIYISFFTISADVVDRYPILYDHVTHSVLIATAIFLSYPIWPNNLKEKRFMAFAWPLGIFFIFFVVGTLLIVMTGFHQIHVMMFILNLVVTTLLIDWPLMLGLLLGGILVAIGAFHFYVGSFPLAEVSDILQFKAIYGIPLFISLLLAIIKNRQAKKALAAQNTYLLNDKKETKDQLTEILSYKNEIIQELDPNDASLFDSTVTAYIRQAVYRLTDYLSLKINPVSVDQVLAETKALLKLQRLEVQPQLIIQQLTKQETLQVDAAKIQQLLVESILYIQAHNPSNKPITLGLEDTKLGYNIEHLPDYTRKLDAIRISLTIDKTLPSIEGIYMVDLSQSTSQLLESKEGMQLADNLRIIDAHYGYIDINQPTTHIYVIPCNVRAVRGKVMELLRIRPTVFADELAHPLAIQLEKELYQKIAGTHIDRKEIAKALNTIKKYHGGVKRKSGEPFFTHLIAVSLIVLDYTQDQDAIVAALLHDVVEDTALSMVHVKAIFGDTVASLVSKATNLEDKIRRLTLQDHEYNHLLMHADDARAGIVKVADRLHNMRTIEGHTSLVKQKYIANETLIFFVPLAEKLGLKSIAEELEGRCLAVLGK